MQKVERQKHKDRKRRRLTGLLLCAVLLAGCVTAAILLRNKAEEPPPESRKRITGAITKRKAEDLKQVTITLRGEKPWSLLQDEDGKLTLQRKTGTETEEWAADGNTAKMILDAAANLTYEDVFTENREDWAPEAADFGLKEPLVTAEILFRDGQQVTARIGDSADPEDNAYYYLTVDGDDRLYAIASGTVEDLRSEKELLHPVHQIQIFSALLDRITVLDAGGSVLKEWTLQGKVSDRDAAENWLVTVPFTYPADYDVIKNMRDNAESLRLGVYVGEENELNLKDYGLDSPTAVLVFHMAEGSTGTVSDAGVYDVSDWEERTVILKLGSKKTDMVDYVLCGGEVYTINHFTVSTFTETEPIATAARYLAATPLNSLESVMVEKSGQETVHYALIHQSGDDDAGNEGETASTDRCIRNGKEIPYDTFSAAYERLMTVTVSGKLKEDYRPGKTHTKYTFRTVSGGTHTIELANYDGMHDAVTMDGCTLFYLIKDGMTELP